MSFAEDPAHPIARKVDFVDKSSADVSLHASRRSSEATAAAAVPDAADDRAKRLAAWREQKDQKQRGATRPGAAAARGKAPGRDAAKGMATDRGREGAQRGQEAAGKRRSSRESPSKRRSPQAQDASVPISVQPKATPLLERLVRDGQASGALPGGSPSLASLSTALDQTPPSPSFPSFASFASRSAVNLSTSSAATPSKALLSASTVHPTQPSSTPVKVCVCVYVCVCACVPAGTSGTNRPATRWARLPAAKPNAGPGSDPSARQFAAFGATAATPAASTPSSLTSSRAGLCRGLRTSASLLRPRPSVPLSPSDSLSHWCSLALARSPEQQLLSAADRSRLDGNVGHVNAMNFASRHVGHVKQCSCGPSSLCIIVSVCSLL